MNYAIVTHGGASSNPEYKDGTQEACNIGLKHLKDTGALGAVIKAVEALENDPRFNAGTGSVLREDGKTIQMDAACMESKGKFGAVAVIERVKNPILIAREVMETSALVLSGAGATDFAHSHGYEDVLVQPRREEACVTDTVGAVAYDGENFAAALSSGGLTKAAIGRIGDVPIFGCGLYCGPSGAVAATGDGEDIIKQLLAYKVYGWLQEGIHPEDAAVSAVGLFPDTVDVGIIILNTQGYGAKSKNKMAWSMMQEKQT